MVDMFEKRVHCFDMLCALVEETTDRRHSFPTEGTVYSDDRRITFERDACMLNDWLRVRCVCGVVWACES